jgi:hypothetical protein
MNLLDLLKGKTSEDEHQLETVKNTLPANTKTLWYPSSGMDFRDVLRFSVIHEELNVSITEFPDLFVHADYSISPLKLEEGVIYQDEQTTVTVLQKSELSWKNAFFYSAKIPFTSYRLELDLESGRKIIFTTLPQSLPKKPVVLLLSVQIESEKVGKMVRPVLFVLMENFNFLCEILLRNQIHISHLVKVRDGSECNQSLISAAALFPFLPHLKVKYLISDYKGKLYKRLSERICEEYGLELHLVRLQQRALIKDWSLFPVNVFSLEHESDCASWNQLEDALEPVFVKTKELLKIEKDNHTLDFFFRMQALHDMPYRGPIQ